jgi:hypothetical protein
MQNAECGINEPTPLIKENGMKMNDYRNMTGEKQNYLKERTKMFALQIIKLVEQLPKGRTADVIGRQLLESGTSVRPITVLHAGQDRLLTSSRRWELLRKRLTKQYIGWSFLFFQD